MKRLSEFRMAFFALLFSVVLVLSACAAQTGGNLSAWQEQYDLGMRYLTESNYEEAILAFTAAIEIDPKQADSYVYLTQVYLSAGNIEMAETIRAQGYEATGDVRLSQSIEDGWVIYACILLLLLFLLYDAPIRRELKQMPFWRSVRKEVEKELAMDNE